MLDSFLSFLGLGLEPVVTPLPPALPAILQELTPTLKRVTSALAPVVRAESALVWDIQAGRILWSQNANAKLPIASLTKLMTAIVAKENLDLDEVVVVGANAAAQPPAKVWLLPGEEITVRDLLTAILIKSGNDAAAALAEHIGVEKFVELMNAKAVTIGLTRTHFANAIGMDDPKNYSTAYDLTILAGAVLRDQLLAELVSQPKGTIWSIDGKHRHDFKSTNQLFGSYLNIQGLKTGSTPEAGDCFIGLAQTPRGRQILVLVLNSPDRFQEGKVLLEWVQSNFR